MRALTAEILILKYNVDALIYAGVAGGVNPSLEIGDVVIGERTLYHDFGKITPGQFILFDTLGFKADSFLISTACAAVSYVRFDPVPEPIAKTKNRFPQIKIGRIATGDQFIASEEKRQWLEKILGVDCGRRRSPGLHN